MLQPQHITDIFWAAMLYSERPSGATPAKWGYGERLANDAMNQNYATRLS